MRYIYYLLIVLFSFLGGDSPEDAAVLPPDRVVTEIQVTAHRDGGTVEKIYRESDQMKAILDYLRLLDPYHKAAIDPETFRSDTWEIRVCCSDGTSTLYRQIYRDYLQKDNGIWRQIDAEGDLLFLTS